jgi:hypothetical protein
LSVIVRVSLATTCSSGMGRVGGDDAG